MRKCIFSKEYNFLQFYFLYKVKRLKTQLVQQQQQRYQPLLLHQREDPEVSNKQDEGKDQQDPEHEHKVEQDQQRDQPFNVTGLDLQELQEQIYPQHQPRLPQLVRHLVPVPELLLLQLAVKDLNPPPPPPPPELEALFDPKHPRESNRMSELFATNH